MNEALSIAEIYSSTYLEVVHAYLFTLLYYSKVCASIVTGGHLTRYFFEVTDTVCKVRERTNLPKLGK